jgi:hypothetical protein
LIRGRECRQGRGGGADLAVRKFEAIESTARHEEQLIPAHIARGAQLAGEFPAFPQYSRLRISAPLAGSGKFCRNQLESREVRRQAADIVLRRQQNAQAPGSSQPQVAGLEPAVKRHDQRRGRIDRGLGEVMPIVDGDQPVTQQLAWHKPFP